MTDLGKLIDAHYDKDVAEEQLVSTRALAELEWELCHLGGILKKIMIPKRLRKKIPTSRHREHETVRVLKEYTEHLQEVAWYLKGIHDGKNP